MKTTRRAAIPLVPVALIAVIVVLGGAFGYYFITASGTISSQSSQISSQSSVVSAQSNQISSLGSVVSSQSSQVSTQSAQISSQSGQISSQSGQLSAQSAQIATQAAQIAADNTQIANLTSKVNSLKTQVAADQAKIQSLTTGYAASNATIVSLNSQIATLNTQIATLNGEIATDNAQIASLQAQVASLMAITGLSDSTNEASGTYYTGGSGSVAIVTFTANYAGYVAMSFTAASDAANEGMTIDLTYGANVNAPTYSGLYLPCCGYFYIVGYIPGSVVIPVTSGTVTVYLETSDFTSQSGTLTVTYYY